MNPSAVSALTSLIVASTPAVAAAQSGAALPSDPQRDSPAGTTYRIPLDSGRSDAAPRTLRPDSGAGESSPIRSENGFGSSSDIPGVRADAGGSGGSGTGVRSGPRGSAGPTEEHERAGGPRPTTASAALSSARLGDSGPSAALALSLVALAVLVGGGAGTAAARARRAS